MVRRIDRCASVSRMMMILTATIDFTVVILYNQHQCSERIRELSSIKVLGFLNKEVTIYIYRETIFYYR